MSSAAKDGDIAALKKDIDEGADVNRLDEKGISPLAWAAVMGQDDAVTLLLEANADINRRNADGGTPLHAAAFFGHANTVTLLLAKGADRNIRNNSGQTALETIEGGWNDQMRGAVEYIAYLPEYQSRSGSDRSGLAGHYPTAPDHRPIKQDSAGQMGPRPVRPDLGPRR